MYDDYRLNGFEPIAVNVFQDTEIVKQYARQYDFMFLSDQSGVAWNLYTMNNYIPLNYVIDPEQKVVGSMEGFSESTIRSWIEPYLSEHGGELLCADGGELWAGNDTNTIQWTLYPKDFSYVKLLLSTDGGNTFPTVIEPSLPPTDTVYRWAVPEMNCASCRVKIQAVDTASETVVFADPSDRSFTIDSQEPDEPALIFPPDAESVNLQSVPFCWHLTADNLSGIDYHTIQVAYDSAFVVMADTARSTDTSCSRVLPADTFYYWRVRATDRCGNVGPWSETWRFRLDAQVPVADEQAGRPLTVANLECQPNPSSGRATVKLALPSPAVAAIAVYDAAGMKVGALWNGWLPAGRHGFNWDARTPAGRAVGPGVYYVRVTAAEWSQVVSVRVVR